MLRNARNALLGYGFLLLATLGPAIPAHAAKLAAGGAHACAIDMGGTARCWGHNEYGQLGNGSQDGRAWGISSAWHGQASAVRVEGAPALVSVTTGWRHSCGFTAGGSLYCWGLNSSGQLGDGSTVNRFSAVRVTGLSSGVKALALGEEHSCALLASGTVQCWGKAANGRLGTGATANLIVPQTVTGLSGMATAIAAGDAHTCAVLDDGRVRCWGYNLWGQIGDGTSGTDRTAPTDVSLNGVPVADVVASGNQTCALTRTSGVKCWGYSANGRLGTIATTTTTATKVPTDVTGLAGGVKAITAGGRGYDSHTCALKTTGQMLCWGVNSAGELGAVTTPNSNLSATPVEVMGIRGVIREIAAGAEHTCALSGESVIQCWGLGTSGRLGFGGVGSWEGSNKALHVVGGFSTPPVKLALGGEHGCGISSEGAALCWGSNEFGQVGDGAVYDSGNGLDQGSPRHVVGLQSRVRDVAVGGSHSCAVRDDGRVWCWGSNQQNQLGGGTQTLHRTPVRVPGIANAVAVEAGPSHTCVLTSTGGVLCWGYNDQGQLGDGTTNQRSAPAAVSGLVSGVSQISLGYSYSSGCARLATGKLKCWGDNQYGQLGDNSNRNDRLVPVDVADSASYVKVAVGGGHACGITTSGQAKCWGEGGAYALGNGAQTDKSTPVAVTGLDSGVTDIDAGGHLFGCAIHAGALKCWGENSSRQLGTGNTTDAKTPIAVTSVSAPFSHLTLGMYASCVKTNGDFKCWGASDVAAAGYGNHYGEQPPLPVSQYRSGAVDGAWLTNNIPLENLAAVAGQWTEYRIAVPTSATALKFATSGGTGDVQLFVQRDTLPTVASNLCAQTGGGAAKVCDLGTPTPGLYRVALHAASDYAGVKLTGSYTATLAESVPMFDLAAPEDGSLSFSVNVPSGMRKLSFDLAGGTGNANLYVRFNGAASPSRFDCASSRSGNAESCVVNNPSAGTWYVTVFGWQAFAGARVSAGWNDGSATYPLILRKSGDGIGAVASVSGDVSCGPSNWPCSLSFAAGTPITLNPTPQAGYSFGGWTGCSYVTGSSCVVTLNHAYDVTARFIGTDNAINLNQHGLSGAWANAEPQAPESQGLVLEVFPGFGGSADRALVFAGWFTYGTNAASGPRWYTVEGSTRADAAESDVLTIYSSTGGAFASGQRAAQTPVGEAILRFSDCTHGSIDYAFDDGRTDTIPLTRLTQNTNCTAQGDSGATGRQLLSGAWADLSTDAQGFVFDVNPPMTLFYAAWYTFKPGAQQSAGEAGQYWWTLGATLPSADFTSLSDIAIFESTGGVFNQRTTPSPETRQVGTASIEFHSCTAATLHYRFTSGINTGRQGTLTLARVGPVPEACSFDATGSPPSTYKLNVQTTGPGSVTSNPAGINCGSACSADMATGATVVLTATAASNSRFTGWGGACTGTSTTCQATMSAARSVTATFVPKVHSVAVGGRHSCALTLLGGVECWGYNNSGQLGDGTATTRSTPAPVTGLSSGVQAISAGSGFTCALTTAGAVKCWGYNDRGQLGDGTNTHRSTPVQVSGLSSGIMEIAAGGEHACAVTNTGVVKCWGGNDYGALGNGGTAHRNSPVTVSGLSGAMAISAGAYHTCAATQSGVMRCWGLNGQGQLGDSTYTDRLTPVVVTNLSFGVEQGGAGGTHSCAIVGGGARCWGWNAEGAVGDGTTVHSRIPMTVSGLSSGVAKLAAGWNQTCAITTAGAAKCWGENDQGQLGDGTTTNRLVPVAVSGLSSGVVDVDLDAGWGYHACAVTAAGTVKCWGNNEYGSLGDGTTVNRHTPVEVVGIGVGAAVASQYLLTVQTTGPGSVTSSPAGIDCGSTCSASFAPGATVTLVAAASGNAVFTGWTGACSGMAATCMVTMSAEQVVGATFSDLGGGNSGSVREITVGRYHTCALTTAGAVWCWGSNLDGSLGDGTTTDHLTPVAVVGLSHGVQAITSGGTHTCALVTGGEMRCWGSNHYGQLGDGTAANRSTPVISGFSSGIQAISAGNEYTCALTDGGAVRCWGRNQWGQLGDGTTTDRLMPVAVVGLPSGIRAISAGVEHTCALTSAGSAWCWGRGMLGDGSTYGSWTPVAVTGLTSGLQSISAGYDHTCVVNSTGAALCWGYGALGNGTTSASSMPVAVSGLSSGVQTISAGWRYSCALTSGGAALCWGANLYALGVGGDGGMAQYVTIPSPVIGLSSGVSAISASKLESPHTCALTNTGAAHCWGSNLYGQLGDGTRESRMIPASVVGLP